MKATKMFQRIAAFAVSFSGLTALPLQAAMPPEENRISPETLPTPYSADEIREASPPGHTTVYRIQLKGEPPMRRISTFLAGGDPGIARFVAVEENGLGERIGEPQTAEATWTELQAHAAFPESMTRIGEDQVSTPAGDYDCWLYTLTRNLPTDTEDGLRATTSITRFWFAKELPGPPVMLEQEVNGETILLMTLLRVYRKELLTG